MTALPDVIRQSALLNQLVLTRSTMEELGRIEVLWMYPQAHRVLGFVCKAGFLGNRKLAFKLSQVEAIGTNGILTHSQPDATDAERVRQLESLIHCEVWSTAGHKIGKIIDCEFNPRSGVIMDYLLVSDRLSELAGSIYRLPPAKVVSFGKRVLVAETSVQEFAAYREGIPQKLSKVSHLFKEEGSQVTQDLRSLAKRAQETTLHTTAHLKTLAEQARDRAQILAEQAKERAQELNEQLRENAETFVEHAKETGETLIDQLHDRGESTEDDWDGEPWQQSPRKPVPQPDAIADDFDAIFADDDFDDDFDLDNEPPTRQSPHPKIPTPSRTPAPNPAPLHAPTTADVEIIAEIETVLEEIDELFGRDPSRDPVPNQSQNPSPNPIKDDWGLDDETPWSEEKINFRRSQSAAPDDFDHAADPWNITELPTRETVPLSTEPLPELTNPPLEPPTEKDDEPWI